MKGNIKNRPRRLFYDEKLNKYFYLINKKKKYIKVSKDISQKQVAKINIKNIVAVPTKKRVVRPRKSIKPILTTQIVSKLVPIAPVSQNLIPPSKNLYMGKDELEKRIQKLEEGFKPVDASETSKKQKNKIPKPAIIKTDEEIAVEKGFEETNPDPSLEDEGDIIISTKKKRYNKDFKKNLGKIILEESSVKEFDYNKFIDWWATSEYAEYRIPKPDEYIQFAKEFLPSVDEEGKTREEILREKRLIFIESITGKGSYSNDDDGIYNDELQEIFKDKTNKFLPVISSDRMNTLIPMVNKHTKKFGWIQNTEPSSSKGRHWVAWFIDIPNLEINYYDSLAENEGMPTKESLKGLKKIIDKIHPEYYLLLKYNQIRDQNPMSKNCGYFALKFIMDRYRNIPFKTATGYDTIYNDVVDNYGEGEKKIKRFKMYL